MFPTHFPVTLKPFCPSQVVAFSARLSASCFVTLSSACFSQVNPVTWTFAPTHLLRDEVTVSRTPAPFHPLRDIVNVFGTSAPPRTPASSIFDTSPTCFSQVPFVTWTSVSSLLLRDEVTITCSSQVHEVGTSDSAHLLRDDLTFGTSVPDLGFGAAEFRATDFGIRVLHAVIPKGRPACLVMICNILGPLLFQFPLVDGAGINQKRRYVGNTIPCMTRQHSSVEWSESSRSLEYRGTLLTRNRAP